LPEPNLQRQQSVLNLLNNFNGIDPLKTLFWSELNYDRVNQSLSRRGWKDSVANLLADDPVVLASGANDFQVIYGRLTSNKLLMGRCRRPRDCRCNRSNGPYRLRRITSRPADDSERCAGAFQYDLGGWECDLKLVP
jgi:hypothetical protein